MSVRYLLLVTLSTLVVFGFAACAPAEEAPVTEEAPPPPPPPPPTIYELTEVDIVAEDPDFTSRNVSFEGIKIGDLTNDVLDVLGDQTGQTTNLPEHYLSAYRNGGLLIYTFKINGEVRQIEVMSRIADEIASPPLRAWLEDGDVDAMRELMGGFEREIIEEGETGGTEYVYDPRGIRFVTYEGQNSIRFSYYR